MTTSLNPPQALAPDANEGRWSKSEALPVLARMYNIALRRKWVVIGSISVALLIGIVTTLLTTPIYTASATIEIAREGDQVVKVGGVEKEVNVADQEFYQTQYGLLKSKALAERMARGLRLADNRDFFAMYGVDVDSVALTGKAGRALRERRAGEILSQNISIAPVRLSRLVNISYSSPDPKFSAMVVNALAANFIQTNLERRFESTSYARKFLEDRLSQLRTKLEDTERQLVAYAQQQRIINIPSSNTADGAAVERPIAAEELSALNSELAAAIADRIRAESRVNARGATTEAFANAAIGSLRQRRVELQADYAKLMQAFEPDYPPARAIALQIAEIDRGIAREEARARETLTTAYRDSQTRERTLKARVDELQSGLLDLRRRSIQYNIYQRDVDTTRELYNGLLQRYKEIGVAGGVGTNNVSVIDEAKVPERPSRPNLVINLLLALALGSIAAAAITFAIEQLDESITDPSEVQQRIGIAVLGTIPKLDADQTPIEALANRKSELIDAYVAVQTNLEFATAHGFPRSISVSSTRPGEGKSTTAMALAAALARAGRKIVLIDGDMRSPSVHGLLGGSNKHGLSNYLAGADNVTELLQSVDAFGFTIMPAGPMPPNAAELLVTDRFSTLISTLLRSFDVVIVDAPPVMGLADAPLIAGRVEGVVFVVESHAIRARLVRTALSRLDNTGSRILGAVLTKFDARRSQLGYGYDYGYGYGSRD